MNFPKALAVLVAALAFAGCSEEDVGVAGSGGGGGSDAGDDGGQDSDTGEDCGSQETTDPVSGKVWRHCRAGSTWEWSFVWDRCECDAAGHDVQWDQIHEDKCPEGFRVPTAQEMMEVLEGCNDWGTIADGGLSGCSNCPDSYPCDEMFPSERRNYWSATEAGEETAYSVSFVTGTVSPQVKTTTHYVLCIEQ